MIIVVSDTHLGYNNSDSKKFEQFIDSELMDLNEKDNLVLLGDLFEFSRAQNVDAVIENQQILSKIYNISKNTNVHYIIGNHDYTVQNFYNNFKKNFPDEKYAFGVGKFLRLKDGDLKFYFMHGYQLEVITALEPLTIEDYENICVNLCDRTNNIIGRTLSTL